VIALRYVYALALAVWLGGAAMLAGVAAPSIFSVLQTREGLAGRVAAGAVFGEVLRRYHVAAYAAGGVMLAALGGMALVGPRPRPYGARLALIALMLAVALVSGLVVSRRLERLQQQIGGPVAALEPGDARRVEFGRLHALSTLLVALDVAGGLVLLYWEAKGR
jgi:hypothetical protein